MQRPACGVVRHGARVWYARSTCGTRRCDGSHDGGRHSRDGSCDGCSVKLAVNLRVGWGRDSIRGLDQGTRSGDSVRGLGQGTRSGGSVRGLGQGTPSGDSVRGLGQGTRRLARAYAISHTRYELRPLRPHVCPRCVHPLVVRHLQPCVLPTCWCVGSLRPPLAPTRSCFGPCPRHVLTAH
jgi:hypothetical protein